MQWWSISYISSYPSLYLRLSLSVHLSLIASNHPTSSVHPSVSYVCISNLSHLSTPSAYLSVCLCFRLDIYTVSTVGNPFIRRVYMHHLWMSPVLSMTPSQRLSRRSDSLRAIGWQFSTHQPHGRSPPGQNSLLTATPLNSSLTNQTWDSYSQVSLPTRGFTFFRFIVVWTNHVAGGRDLWACNWPTTANGNLDSSS